MIKFIKEMIDLGYKLKYMKNMLDTDEARIKKEYKLAKLWWDID